MVNARIELIRDDGHDGDSRCLYNTIPVPEHITDVDSWVEELHQGLRHALFGDNADLDEVGYFEYWIDARVLLNTAPPLTTPEEFYQEVRTYLEDDPYFMDTFGDHLTEVS